MNTTIEAVLYTSKTLSNGQHPIMLRLTKNRKRKYISLHISLALQYWDAEKCKPRRNCPDKERIEALIQQKTQELQSQVMDFKTSDKEYTLNTLVEKASRKVVRQTVGEYLNGYIDRLLAGEWHEMRTCALFILVMQAERCQKTLARRQTPPAEKKAAEQEWGRLVDFYPAHSARINNWDLVDLSAPQVVGRYLIGRPSDVLYRLAESDLLWDNRIAIVSTYALIKVGELDDTYRLALQLLHHPHDLMHKAVGIVRFCGDPPQRDAAHHAALRYRAFRQGDTKTPDAQIVKQLIFDGEVPLLLTYTYKSCLCKLSDSGE